MTLKELLDEQEKKVSDYFGDGISTEAMKAFSKGEDIDRAKMKELQDFLRQNTIDTIKWVRDVMEARRKIITSEYQQSTGGDNQRYWAGRLDECEKTISELTKSIEDHA